LHYKSFVVHRRFLVVTNCMSESTPVNSPSLRGSVTARQYRVCSVWQHHQRGLRNFCNPMRGAALPGGFARVFKSRANVRRFYETSVKSHTARRYAGFAHLTKSCASNVQLPANRAKLQK
jgi:hypothetical protein